MNIIKYNEGGSLSKENKEMLMNQAIELKHHADELMNVLQKSDYIEPWVVAKAERATTDLSDITHYLEGNSKKMKWGGYMGEGGEVSEFNLEQFLNFIYPNVKEIMDSNNISIDKEFIVSKDMEIAYVPHFMYEYEDEKVSELAIYYFDAQDKHIGHIEIDLEEKEIEVEFPSWSLDDEGKYSKGGRLDVGRYYKTKSGKQVRYLGSGKDPEYGTFTNKTDGVSNIRYDEIEGHDSIFEHGGKVYVDLFEYRHEMPYKVEVIVDKYEDEYGEDISYQSLLDMQRDVEEVGYTFDFGLDSMPYGLRPIGVEITQLRDYDEDNQYGDGGYMANGGELRKIKGNNFSEQIENGQKFKAIIQKVYDEQKGDHKYPLEFIKATAMTKLPIVKSDGKNYIKGYMYKGTITNFQFLDDANFEKALEFIDRPPIKTFKYADGGATFKDKVKSISKRLDKTKVPLKYRKEYGKYFDKKEADKSAQRIVGAMTKKEK